MSAALTPARSRAVWLAALWIGLLIHVDWHLGRPVHHRLSYGLSYHWLLGLVAFVPVVWVIGRRWSHAFLRASLLTIGLGVVLGQGLEPLGEVLLLPAGWLPFTDPVRWRVFGEFLLAGGIAYVATAVAAGTRHENHEP